MNEKNYNNYSVIVTYRNGSNRGYTIQADGQKEVFGKLMTHINFDLIRKVEIAEIVMDEDMIR